MQVKTFWQERRLIKGSSLATALIFALQVLGSYTIAYAEPAAEGGSSPLANSADQTLAMSDQPALREPISTSTESATTTNPPADHNISLAAASASTTSSGTPTSITAPSPLLSGVVVAETNDPVDKITRDILSKIFELERLNTYYRIESTGQSKWRRWRMLIAEEGAAISVAAGILVAIEQSLRSLHTGYKFHTIQFGPTYVFAKVFRPPGKIPLEHSFVTALPGVWFAVLQETYEVGQNYFADWQAKQKGFDAKTTRLKAASLQGEIDNMLAEREKLIAAASISQNEKDVEGAEQKVLKDMRDITLQEYSDYFVGAKRQRCYQNMWYWLDIAEKVTGVVSLQQGLLGIVHNNVTSLGPSFRYLQSFGVLQLISAALVEITPPGAKLYSVIRANMAKKKIDKTIHGDASKTAEVFDADRKHLEDVYLSTNMNPSNPFLSNMQARDAIYRMEGETFYALQAAKDREHAIGKKAFWDSMKVRTIACAGKTVFGISGLLLGDGREKNPRHLTEIILMGTIPYEVALDANIYDRWHTSFKLQKKEDQLKAKGELYGQIYQARLERLDQMQNVIAPKRITP